MTLIDAALGLSAILLGLVAWLARQLYGRVMKDVEVVHADIRELRDRVLRLEVRTERREPERPDRWEDPIEAIRREWLRLKRESGR